MEILMNYEQNNLKAKFIFTCLFSIFFISACLSIMIFLPSGGEHYSSGNLENQVEEDFVDYTEIFFAEDSELPKVEMDLSQKEDSGLSLYRQPQSRAAVEWFYSRITNSREVAQAILTAAEENNIPLSLAFALAHTESNFKTNAMHKNSNGSIDRGLFQLNNNSFPNLTESEFYDPKVSARFGLSHLKFCLSSAGNEIAALAMYNAGTSKVRKNNTPQITLNYISKIQNYKSALEENFAVEVLALYDSKNGYKLLAKFQ